jgi:hypothetical protein
MGRIFCPTEIIIYMMLPKPEPDLVFTWPRLSQTWANY